MKNIILPLCFLTLTNIAFSSNDDISTHEAQKACRNGIVSSRSDGGGIFHNYCYCCQRGTEGSYTSSGVVCNANDEDIKQVRERWGHLSQQDQLRFQQGMLVDYGVKCKELKAGTVTGQVRWEKDRDASLDHKKREAAAKERQEQIEATELPSNLSNCQRVNYKSLFHEIVIICNGKAYGRITNYGARDQYDLIKPKEQLQYACRKTSLRNPRNDERECATNEEYACCIMGQVDNIRTQYYKRLSETEEVQVLNTHGTNTNNGSRDAENSFTVPAASDQGSSSSATSN